MRFVALLASVNVGGNRIRMDALRAALGDAGFRDVETVTASGNVLFSAKDGVEDGPGEEIAAVVERHFGFRPFVAVRDAVELAAAIKGNPFAGTDEDKLVHTHFLEHQPARDAFERLLADHRDRGPERLALGDRALYIDFVEGVAGSKLTGAFIAKRIGCRGTARNMRSLARILERMT